MSRILVRRHAQNDLRRMMQLAWRLIVLTALLLMPMGMAAPATAAVHHDAAAGMPMEHCPDQAPNEDSKTTPGACVINCSAALPALDIAQPEPALIITTRVEPVVAGTLHGIKPETATPPPKFS